MVLKWRDYVARLDDESPDYMLPKHILFSIAREMPTSRNELRDCRRASAEPPAIQKYQDQLLAMIQAKLAKKKDKAERSNLNIIFNESQSRYKVPDEDVKMESTQTKTYKIVKNNPKRSLG